ncbi:MAG: Flp pilus assembly protein CpaB [Desulfovibrionaceae bacterium]|nr:Flp pilus assembly protein CpaB [Desulfovibrionaceae bacterium]
MSKTKLILISLGVALFALLLVYSYIYKKEKELLSLATPVKVVVAAKDVPEGTALDESFVEIVEIPKNFVQPGALSEVAEVLDRETAVPLLKGAQILDSLFRPAGDQGVARKIPADKRAYSIAVNDVSAVAGLVKPGDFVDVVVTAQTGSVQQGRPVADNTLSRVLLQNVLVLAVNQQSTVGGGSRTTPRQAAEGGLASGVVSGAEVGDGAEHLRTLTLALSVQDVQRVALGQEIGSLSVALRSSWQKAEQALPLANVTAQDVLGTEKTVVPRSRPVWTEFRGSEAFQVQ